MSSRFTEYFPHGIKPGMIVPYAHKGNWAVHEVLPFLFHHIGPFHLSLATFNVSEESLRPIFFMKEREEIISARFLLDFNVKRHKIDMMFFAKNIADKVRSSYTHMKVILCQNDDIRLSVVGSANMNRNPRHEAGYFATDEFIFDYYMEYFNDVYENDSIPFII